MPSGARPGERRGGRKKGVHNKTSVERAAEVVANAKATNTPLAKDILERFMLVFAGQAAVHQPRPDGLGGMLGNSKEFERWARLSVDCAGKLAPYQSPTFRAVMVTTPGSGLEGGVPMPSPRPGEGQGEVIDETGNVVPFGNAMAVARVYQRIIAGSKG